MSMSVGGSLVVPEGKERKRGSVGAYCLGWREGKVLPRHDHGGAWEAVAAGRRVGGWLWMVELGVEEGSGRGRCG